MVELILNLLAKFGFFDLYLLLDLPLYQVRNLHVRVPYRCVLVLAHLCYDHLPSFLFVLVCLR